MQDIYTYIPETNYVPREYSVTAILSLLFMVLISLVPVLNQLFIITIIITSSSSSNSSIQLQILAVQHRFFLLLRTFG